MVFSPNTLTGAPANLLATISLPKTATTADEVRLARTLGKTFPVVTTIRVKEAIEAFNVVFGKVMSAVRVAGSVTLLAGALVLAGAMATASTFCGACEEVCPVRIPITDILRRLRTESYRKTDAPNAVKGHGYKRTLAESLTWQGWALSNATPWLNALNARLLGLAGPHLSKLPQVGLLKHWGQSRALPPFASKSLHVLAKEKGISDE